MRLLADENIAAPLVRMLRKQGFDIMLRLPAAERAHWPRVVALLQLHEKRLPGSYVVIDLKRLRVRPLPDRNDA